MIMFNRKMLGIGKDIRLAHCWYRWGDEVVAYPLRNYVHFDHDDMNTKVSWVAGPMEIRRNIMYLDEIESFSDDFIFRYSGKEGSENLIDDVYRDAPYDFQKEYRKVRENLKIALHSKKMMNNYNTSTLKPLFVDAMKSFPEDFNKIRRYKDDFENVFLVALDSGAPIKELFYMSEDFWFFFCYYLRIRCHNNVSNDTLSRWKEKIPSETERFEWRVQDITSKYLGDSDDKNVKRVLDARSIRISESDELIESFTNIDQEKLRKFLGRS